MSESVLPAKACWSKESADAIFHTEALTGDDALFLATHTPISGFVVEGSQSVSITDRTETSLLEALSREEVNHAFCAIEGEPGSGKSHLIRWLGLNWPKDRNDIVLLLQRSDGSLEGALEQLRLKLPDEFSGLFTAMGARRNISSSGRARQFFSNLRQTLHDDYYEDPPEDLDWIKKTKPEGLFRKSQLESGWNAPKRIMEIISGAGGNRDQASASFGITDISELLEFIDRRDLQEEVRSRACPRASFELFAKLSQEKYEYEELLAEGVEDSYIFSELADEVSYTRQLIEALNRRLNDAIQPLIGVTAGELKKLFKDVRTELAYRGQRLVLLLEDITSWQGLDHGLLDVLVTDAGTRQDGDICALISVIGITPDFVLQLRGNDRDRLTHWIKLGEGENTLQDVAMLREREGRLKYSARYLSATRTGLNQISHWFEDRAYGTPPPNPCDSCDVREGCHRAFGEIEGIGLFPFTADAIDNFYFALKTDDGGHTRRTPRGMIQAVLMPTLAQPETIARGEYPSELIELPALDLRSLTIANDRLLQNRLPDQSQKPRLKRFLSLWGKQGDFRTTTWQDQALAFDGIPDDVFRTFKLPWPGADKEEGAPPIFEPEEPQPEAETPTSPTPSHRPEAETPTPPTPVPPPLNPRKPKGPNLDRRDIETWRTEGRLPNQASWERVIHDAILGFDYRAHGFDRWSWESIFTENSIHFQGMVRERRGTLLIPPEEWVKNGLEAYAILEKNAASNDQERHFYKICLAQLHDNLESLATDFARSRLGTTDDDRTWQPSISAVQILLIRGWLRGAISPTDSCAAQWQALFSDEPEVEVQAGSRTAKWRDFLTKTNPYQSRFRKMLREAVSIPQGQSRDFGLASGNSAAAVFHLIRDQKFIGLPTNLPVQNESSPFTPLAELALLASSNLAEATQQEKDLLADRSHRAMAMLRGQTPRAHIARIDDVFDIIANKIPDAAPNLITEWKSALTQYKTDLANMEFQEALLDTLATFSEPEELPSGRAELLKELTNARSTDLDKLLALLGVGEKALKPIADFARSVIGSSGPEEGKLGDVHRLGDELMTAGERLLKASGLDQ